MKIDHGILRVVASALGFKTSRLTGGAVVVREEGRGLFTAFAGHLSKTHPDQISMEPVLPSEGMLFGPGLASGYPAYSPVLTKQAGWKPRHLGEIAIS